MPTAWWLRPVSIAARLAEQTAVTWNRLYRRPCAATRSMFGVRKPAPKQPSCAKPMSSSTTISTFGASGAGAGYPTKRGSELSTRVVMRGVCTGQFCHSTDTFVAGPGAAGCGHGRADERAHLRLPDRLPAGAVADGRPALALAVQAR